MMPGLTWSQSLIGAGCLALGRGLSLHGRLVRSQTEAFVSSPVWYEHDRESPESIRHHVIREPSLQLVSGADSQLEK